MAMEHLVVASWLFVSQVEENFNLLESIALVFLWINAFCYLGGYDLDEAPPSRWVKKLFVRLLRLSGEGGYIQWVKILFGFQRRPSAQGRDYHTYPYPRQPSTEGRDIFNTRVNGNIQDGVEQSYNGRTRSNCGCMYLPKWIGNLRKNIKRTINRGNCIVELTSSRNTQRRDLPECPICLEDLGQENGTNNGNRICMLRRCKHKFHLDCIHQWLTSRNSGRRTCPICRRRMTL